MSDDIFIRYLDEDGKKLARHIADRLSGRGFRPYIEACIDNDNYYNGNFQKIDSCTNYLIILSNGSLDRCKVSGDKLKLELIHVLDNYKEFKSKKTIIPVMMPKFAFPNDLPDEIAEIKYFQGIDPNDMIFDQMIDKLSGLLIQNSITKNKKKILKISAVVVFITLICIVIGCISLSLSNSSDQYSELSGLQTYNIAKVYYDAEDYANAFSAFKSSSEKGYTESMFWLGMMYLNGRGANTDYDAAFKWLTKAANMGDVESMTKLGQLYYLGTGKTVDYKSAFEWFTKAAELGDHQSMSHLGLMYRYGLYVPADIDTAKDYYKKAAELGDDYAQKMYIELSKT